MKHELKKVSPLAAGKIIGILYAALTLLLVPFAVLFIIIGAVGAAKGEAEAIGGIGAGIFFLLAPVFYGVMGFIFGVIVAWVYNLISWKFGGLVFETAPKE